jgi:predicted nuclease of predicted toxin-antitoxin system
MKFLVDANLSPKVAARLSTAGHEATHVIDHGLLAATDDTILLHAVGHGEVIVSADTDFTIMLAVSGAKSPSLILLRSADRLAPVDQADLILANLPAVLNDLEAGAVVSLSTTRLRVRSLPMR